MPILATKGVDRFPDSLTHRLLDKWFAAIDSRNTGQTHAHPGIRHWIISRAWNAERLIREQPSVILPRGIFANRPVEGLDGLLGEVSRPA